MLADDDVEWTVTIPYGDNWEYREAFERWFAQCNCTHDFRGLTANIHDTKTGTVKVTPVLHPVFLSSIEMYWDGSGDPGTFDVRFSVSKYEHERNDCIPSALD